MTRTGACLCGAVSVSATVEPGIQVCHCTECQRWTGGGPFLTVKVRDLELSGEANVSAYHHSAWGERAVCATCGSPLYWRMQGQPVASLAVGLLRDQSGLQVGEEIFVDYRPDWMPAWPGATQSTEAQEMAKLAAALEGQEK